MNNYICENAIIQKNGISQCIRCKANNDYCYCVRYCPTKKEIEHDDNAEFCLLNPNRKEK